MITAEMAEMTAAVEELAEAVAARLRMAELMRVADKRVEDARCRRTRAFDALAAACRLEPRAVRAELPTLTEGAA